MGERFRPVVGLKSNRPNAERNPNSCSIGPGPGLGHRKPTATIDSPVKNMRSSIACVRCRRSKVKCVNTGPNTTCRACESSNRECTYPQPVASGAPRASANATMALSSVTGAGSGGLGGASAERVEVRVALHVAGLCSQNADRISRHRRRRNRRSQPRAPMLRLQLLA